MKESIGHALSVFMAFFAIMNPIANTPIFLGLTSGDPPEIKRRVAMQALLISFILILVFVVAGRLIFTLFGITLPAFQIMGGLLVAVIGYQMLHGQQSAVHQPTAADQKSSRTAALSVALTPLAMPILAGPGTIATAMNFASTGGLSDVIVTIVAFAVLCVITYVFFLSGQRLLAFLGENGLNVVTRLMGLILAVIGVQMLITGLSGAVKANLS
jgi:multiple antibiotic resistance protein